MSPQEIGTGKLLDMLVLVSLLLLCFQPPAACSLQLSDVEHTVIDFVSGSNAYAYAQQLESIGLDFLAYRSAGSAGADRSAEWIATQLQNLGLETTIEPFTFKTWNLTAESTLTIDLDGTPQTTGDQEAIQTFQSQHYSWPTPQNGTFVDVVILPLPAAYGENDLGTRPIDLEAWDRLDTTGRIVLTSNYVLMTSPWMSEFTRKVNSQRPLAIVYDSYYSWSPEAQYPGTVFLRSAGGRPLSHPSGLYWDLGIPVGAVSYSDGVRMRELEEAEDISANLTIPAQIADGTHLNVAAKLPGQTQPEKQILITAHYDSVLTPGFGDNAAGVAGILELARAFTQAKQKGTYNPPYTLTFIAFTAEELGLIGSAHYLQTHKTEANQITAVLNLDVIGSTNLMATRTENGEDFDLDAIIGQVAPDLGITLRFEALGSDQESFRAPSEVAGDIEGMWEQHVDIDDVKPIQSSALLISYPYTFRHSPPGWIHTSYDNSTSTTNYGWIVQSGLENHIKVAALSILRLHPSSSIVTTTVVVAVLAVVLIAVVVYLRRRSGGRPIATPIKPTSP